MSDIPKARDQLLWLARRVPGPIGTAIATIVRDHMYRDGLVRPKARVTRRKMTATLRDQIKADINLSITNSDNLDEIGRRHRVAGGRVSEVIHGKWDHL